jgi:hypothetical protein
LTRRGDPEDATETAWRVAQEEADAERWPEPKKQPCCRYGHALTVESRQHACADAFECWCSVCYEPGAPHGHGATSEAAEEDFFEQEWQRYSE